MANEKQTSLEGEIGWPDEERLPETVEPKPELVLAWRGLTIAISEGQMTRDRAIEMLESWDKDEPA